MPGHASTKQLAATLDVSTSYFDWRKNIDQLHLMVFISQKVPLANITRKKSLLSLSLITIHHIASNVRSRSRAKRAVEVSCCQIVVPDDIISNFSMRGRIKIGPRHNYPARVKSEIFTLSPTSNLSIFLLPIAASMFLLDFALVTPSPTLNQRSTYIFMVKAMREPTGTYVLTRVSAQISIYSPLLTHDNQFLFLANIFLHAHSSP